MVNTDAFRSATIKDATDRKRNALGLIIEYLPDGYEYFLESPEKGLVHRIKTPSGDTICLRTDTNNPQNVRTVNILQQDERETPPELQDDELSKLARAISDNKESRDNLSIEVHCSDSDLGIHN